MTGGTTVEEKYIKTLQETKGSFLTFRQDEVALSNGTLATRDIVVHPGAVAIIAVTKEKEVIFVKQYRYPVKEVLYEIPAGKLEKNEDPLLCAKRELSEETGFVAEKWEKISTFYTAPGFANETMHLYYARNLEKKEAHPDPDEIISFARVKFADAFKMIEQEKIKDAKTLIALLFLCNQR